MLFGSEAGSPYTAIALSTRAGGFPRLCRSRAYREHVYMLVLSSIPLDSRAKAN